MELIRGLGDTNFILEKLAIVFTILKPASISDDFIIALANKLKDILNY